MIERSNKIGTLNFVKSPEPCLQYRHFQWGRVDTVRPAIDVRVCRVWLRSKSILCRGLGGGGRRVFLVALSRCLGVALAVLGAPVLGVLLSAPRADVGIPAWIIGALCRFRVEGMAGTSVATGAFGALVASGWGSGTWSFGSRGGC